jgi:hypothetical protein
VESQANKLKIRKAANKRRKRACLEETHSLAKASKFIAHWKNRVYRNLSQNLYDLRVLRIREEASIKDIAFICIQ